MKTNLDTNLYSVSFTEGGVGYAVGANGIILRTADGGLSWDDKESPVNLNLFAVTAIGPNDAVAVGEQGTVIVTADGGETWGNETNITSNVLQAVVFRGGDKVWIGGKGGSILKRLTSLSPTRITSPKLPPVLRNAVPRLKLKPRIPRITITDDGDIPIAAPLKP